MKHYWHDVPGLGNVAVSRHAQEKMLEQGVDETRFADCLHKGTDTPDGLEAVWREKNGLRLVILLQPKPFRGAKLVKTAYLVKAQEKAKK